MKKENIDTTYVMVLSTDGGCRPNPGFIGIGINGYIYDIASIGSKTNDKPSTAIPTTKGYIENELKNKYPEAELVKPLYAIDCCYSYIEPGTNNTAELQAIVNALHLTCRFSKDNLPISKLILRIDSEYAIGCLNKLLNKQPPETFSNLNLDILTEMFAIVNSIDFEIEIIKVAGHSTDVGNHIADILATIGVYKSKKGIEEAIENIVEYKNEWSKDETISPLLNFKQLFFTNAVKDESLPSVYAILDYKKDMLIGEKTPKATFGYIAMKEPVKMIDETIKAFTESSCNNTIISTIDLKALYSRNTSKFFKMLGNDIFIYKTYNTMYDMEKTPIVYNIHPAGLANQAMDKVMMMSNILNDYYLYKANSKSLGNFIDITDMVYKKETDKKGKLKVECILPNGCNEIVYEKDDMKIILDLRYDTITRNQFKQLESSNPNVYIGVYKTRGTMLNYYNIIELENGDIGIYQNYYSCRIFN